MKYSLYEIKQYFKEYLIDHNLDKLTDKELQTIVDNNLNKEEKFLETLVIYSYCRYNWNNKVDFGNKEFILEEYFEKHNNVTGNSFELDKKFKGMFLNKNKSEWEREVIKKIYYHKLYDKIKDRNIE